jgi:hypothetical protein
VQLLEFFFCVVAQLFEELSHDAAMKQVADPTAYHKAQGH